MGNEKLQLEDLFVQVLPLAQAMKLIKLRQISLDSTKIKANASKHKALSHGHIEKLEAQLREEIPALLKAITDELFTPLRKLLTENRIFIVHVLAETLMRSVVLARVRNHFRHHKNSGEEHAS